MLVWAQKTEKMGGFRSAHHMTNYEPCLAIPGDQSNGWSQ